MSNESVYVGNVVHHSTEDSARRNGVILVHCRHRGLLGGLCVAVDYGTGKVIRTGTPEWVRSQLEKNGISILKEA